MEGEEEEEEEEGKDGKQREGDDGGREGKKIKRDGRRMIGRALVVGNGEKQRRREAGASMVVLERSGGPRGIEQWLPTFSSGAPLSIPHYI